MPAPVGPNQNVLVTGTLATNSVTADQVIATYTVTAGKTLWLSYAEMNVRLTTFATTATSFGAASLAVNSVKKQTFTVIAGPGVLNAPLACWFDESLPFQAGDVLTIICTPSGTTAFTWEGNIAGYEK